MESKKPLKILKWVLIVGIALVVNLFFNYTLAVVYDTPDYNDYCKQEQVRVIPETENECVAVGGQWTPATAFQKSVSRGEVNVPAVMSPEMQGYCDPDFMCRQGYEDANKAYNRNIFVALVVLGVALVIGSFFIVGAEAVSLGLSFGGILSIITGAMRYWGDMDDYTRVAVLGVALIALIWFGVKKFRE